MQKQNISNNQSPYLSIPEMKKNLQDKLNNYDLIKVPNLKEIVEYFSDKIVYIYGAGSYGSLIYDTLTENGVNVHTFLDIKSKPGDTLFGLPMYKADDTCLQSIDKDNIYVIAAIVKDYATRESIFDFIKQCGFKNIIDAQSIRCHSVYFDNMPTSVSISDHIKNQKNDILRCFDLFSNDQSKTIYYTNLMAHIFRNYDHYIETTDSVQYFPDDIHFTKGYKRFVDCGGYIGDTVDDLVKFKKEIQGLVIFEPVIDNFLKLSSHMDNYTEKIPETYLYPCAVSSQTKTMFIDNMGGSSTLNTDNKDNFVQCVAMDDAIKNFAPTFIKMDVEGEERNAILGAEKIIKKYKPDLAICVYHCINHLWDIMLLIDSWKLGYKFYLKAHNSYTMETVLYGSC